MPFLLAILLLPLVLLLLFFEVASTGLENLGLSPGMAGALLLAMVLGSFVNIPLSKTRLVEGEESRFLGLVKRRTLQAQGLSLNVGGGLIPLVLALYLLVGSQQVSEVLFASALMAAVAFAASRVVPGRGIALPVLVPPLFAALFALLVSPENPGPTAFAAGVLGVILGADVLRLPQVRREAAGMLSIGGAGVFDGIFLIALIAVLLTGL